jgi:hypothetical protein
MNRKYQNGATMWGWLTIMVMVGFLGMLAFKVLPIYFEHRIVRAALQDVVDGREFVNMTNKSILRSIQSRMTINNVRTIDAKAFTAKRDRTGDKFILVNYEVKVAIMSNLSAVVEFNEEIRKK